MAVSNRLQQMGIQQWRLKAGQHDVASAVIAENTTASAEIETPLSSSATEALQAPTDPPASLAAPQPAPVVLPPEPSDPLADMGWQDLQALIDGNQHCPSCGECRSILGSGNLTADWVFISDAPTQKELDGQEIFVGRAGQLFDAIMASLGLARDEVYSSSVFKCAAGDDLSVTPQCKQIVHRQIALIQPKVVVTLGEFAAQAIIRANEDLNVLRNAEQKCHQSKVTIVPTYSLNEMLNEPGLKALVWQDLKRCLGILRSQ